MTDFFDDIDENVEWDSGKKKKKTGQDEAKINAAPVEEQTQQMPQLNLPSDNVNIGGNLFSSIDTKPNLMKHSLVENEPMAEDKQEAGLPEDNRSDEQIIEDYVENNPEEAKAVLPEESDLHEEAEQVNDGDKRTDEVKNEAVEEFIDKEPELADTIVEEAADATNGKDKPTSSIFALDEKEQEAENNYLAGKEKLLNTKPTDKWDIDRIEGFQNDLNSAVESIDPNDPDSIHELAKLERKRRQLLRAVKAKKETEQDPSVIEPLEDEIAESAIDPAEAIYSLQKDEAKEQEQRMADYIKEANEATRRRLAMDDADPNELKKLNGEDKQLAIYDPKALMKAEDELQKTEEAIKEKEDKIRKKWNLPRLDYRGKPMEAGAASGFSQPQAKEPDRPMAYGARLPSKAGSFPTGSAGAAVNYGGAGEGKRLSADVGGTRAVKSTGPAPSVEQVETPSASVKGNKGQAGASGVRPIGGMIGWSSVRNKGGGKIAANKGKAPRFGQGSGGGSTGANLSAKKQADARNITKRDVAQKILAESRHWQVNERGERDSGAELLPVRIYVKDDNIEVSILGTGRKRKSLDGASDQELALIQKVI